MENTKCAICLETWVNPVKLDGCFHTFCWTCALEWAKKSMTCPLCKRSFVNLLHSFDTQTMHYEKISLNCEATIEFYSNMDSPPSSVQRDVRRKAIYVHNLKPVISWEERGLPFPRRRNDKNSQAQRQEIINRLLLWLEKELRALFPGVPQQELAEESDLISTYIITKLENGGKELLVAEDTLQQLRSLVGDKAEQLISELLTYLTSPFTTPQQFNNNVTYASPTHPQKRWSFAQTKPLAAKTTHQPDSFIVISDSESSCEYAAEPPSIIDLEI